MPQGHTYLVRTPSRLLRLTLSLKFTQVFFARRSHDLTWIVVQKLKENLVIHRIRKYKQDQKRLA